MTKHSLTDGMIEVIHKDYVIGKILGPKTKAEFDECLRAAADWQLEQVIDWIEKKRGGTINLHNSEINNLVVDLKKAMRLQLEETNS